MNIDFNAVLNTLAAKAKALALNLTDIELKVLEATNEEPWGPHGKAMQEIARAAEDPEKYNLIMNVISERLQMRDENWRLCYKALLLLEYLVKQGPWRVVEELNRSVSSLERLRDEFEYKDPQGRDQGINVRQRAGELAALVCNTDRVRQEREKAARNASKFKGVSSSDVRGGFGSTNYSSSGSGGGYGYSGFGGGGGGRSQGFGSTESVHAPSSQYRNGGGANQSTGSGVAGGRREEGLKSAGTSEEAEDPFEATRKRIERLKAEGALQDSTAGGPPPGLVDPAAASTKAPKKLSDVKINPAVAATFANISIPSSSSTGSLVKLAAPPPPPPGQSIKLASLPQASSSNNSLDLFGEMQLESQPASQQQQGGGAQATGLDWDAAFAPGELSNGPASAAAAPNPAVAGPAPADLFVDNTVAAPAATAPAAAPRAPATASLSTGFDALFGGNGVGGGGGSSSSASGISAAAASGAKPAVRAPLPFDAFSELGDTSPPVAPLTGKLTTSAAHSSDPAPDPFAALASSSSSSTFSIPAQPMAASRPSAPAAAAVADPFAALSAPRAAAPAAVTLSAPRAAAAATIPFDAFGNPEPQPSRTPQPAEAPAPVSDPFAALASGTARASVPMGTTMARPAPPSAAATAAAAFDPFVSAPVAVAPARPAVAPPAFDAFGSVVSPLPPPPAVAAASSFDDVFGPNLSGQNGQFVAALRTATAAATSAVSDPFATSSFAAFPPPPTTATPAAAANGVTMAMNKSGAAHGVAGHKNHDPFAGLGF